MELRAAIEALKTLKEACHIQFHTDSTYLKNGVTAWVAIWKRNGWRTTAKKPVKNGDLWRALDEVTPIHRVEWKWVKGHAGHAGNERCDELANLEIARVKELYTVSQLQELLAAFTLQNEEIAPEEAPPELF